MSLKKILALVLVFAMCLSFVPTYAFAEDDGIELVEEVEDIVEVVDEPEEEPAAEPVEEETPAEPVEEEVPAEEPAPVEEEPAAEPEEEEEEEEVLVEGAIEDTETFDVIDDTTVLVIGNKSYVSLASATNAANGKTIVVRKDYTGEATINADATYSIEGWTGHEGNEKITQAFTISNGTVSISGIDFDDEVIVDGTANVTIDGATIKGRITVNGGTLTLNDVKATLNSNTVVVNGGELFITGDNGVYEDAISVTSGKATITGGTFKAGLPDGLLGDWYMLNTDKKVVDKTGSAAFIAPNYYYETVDAAVAAASDEDVIKLHADLTNKKFAITLVQDQEVNIYPANNEWDEENSKAPLGYYIVATPSKLTDAPTGTNLYKLEKGVATVGNKTYKLFEDAAVDAVKTGATVTLIQKPTSTDLFELTGSLTVDAGTVTATVTDLFKPVAAGKYIKATKQSETSTVTTYTLTDKPYATGSDAAHKTDYYVDFFEAATATVGGGFVFVLANGESVTATPGNLPSVKVVAGTTDFALTAGTYTEDMVLMTAEGTEGSGADAFTYTTYSFVKAVAQVGSGSAAVKYGTLQNAVAKAGGEEIKLLATVSDLIADPNNNNQVKLASGESFTVVFAETETNKASATNLATTTDALIKYELNDAGTKATISAVAPAASVDGTNYPTFLDAYVASPTGIIKILPGVDVTEWTLGAPTNTNVSTATDAAATLKIYKDSNADLVTVKPADGFTLVTEEFDNPAENYKKYSLSPIVATVNDEPYATLAEAIEAADGTDYPVILTKATESDIVLNFDSAKNTYQELTIGPKAYITTGTDTYMLATPTVTGHNFYIESEENADDTVTFALKELVAEVSYTKNNYTRTEQFDLFADAANFIFAGETPLTVVPEGETTATQSNITLYSAPAADDTWTLTEGYLVVASPTNYVARDGFVTDTKLAVKGTDLRVTTGTNMVTFTMSTAVATVTLGNGDVEYFDSVSGAIRFVQGKDAKIRDNFCVTVIKDVKEVLGTPSNVVATGTDNAFRMVVADGVEATLTAPADELIEEANKNTDFDGTIENGLALINVEDDKWVVSNAKAAVNMGELQTTTTAEFEEVTSYKSSDWRYYPTVEAAIAAADGERVVVVFAEPEDYYDLGEDETLIIANSSSLGIDTLEQKIRHVENVNSSNYKEGYMTIRTDKAPIYTYASGPVWTITYDPNNANITEIPTPSNVFDGDTVGNATPAMTTLVDNTTPTNIFVGWFDGDTQLVTDTVITKNVTAKAKWTTEGEVSYNFFWLTADAATNTSVVTPTSWTATDTRLVKAKAGTDISSRVEAVNGLVPEVAGFEALDGWYTYTDADGYSAKAVDLATMGTTDTNLYKKYEKTNVTAKFYFVGSDGQTSDLGEITVKRGESIPEATLTSLFKDTNRYTLNGWQYKDADGNVATITNAQPLTVNSDLNVTALATARTSTVRFVITPTDLATGTDVFVIASKSVLYDEKIVAPTATDVAAKEGTGFQLKDGYAYDPNDLWATAVPNTVSTDTDILLKVQEAYTVSIVSDGKQRNTVLVAPNSTIKANMSKFEDAIAQLIETKKEANLILDGFVGIEDDYVIETNITVTCAWVTAPDSITASWYDEDGATLLATTTSLFDTAVTPYATVPTKEGTNVKSYTFDGWKDMDATDNKLWVVTGTGSSAKLVNKASNTEIYPTLTKDVSFKATFAESTIDFSDVKFTYALSLSDKISMVFHVKDLPTNTDLDGYEITYTMDGVTGEAVITAYNDNEVVVADLAAKQVVDEVEITAKYKGQMITSETKKLSVKKYCDTVVNTSSGGNLFNLCKALLNYGYAAQQIFSYKTDTPAVSPAPEFKQMDGTGVTITKAQKTLSDNGITGVSANVNLESKIEFFVTLKHDATANLEDYTISVDNSGKYTEIETSDTGTGFLVKIKGIAAKDLGTDFTVSAKKGNSVSSVKMSPFTYCYAKSNNANATANAKNLAVGLFEYGTAAAAYAAHPNN